MIRFADNFEAARRDAVILGIDPGKTIACCAVALQSGRVVACGSVTTDYAVSVAEQAASVRQLLAEWRGHCPAPHCLAVVEDVTAGAYMDSSPYATARLNRLMGMLTTAALEHLGACLTVRVGDWYPRQGNRPMAKAHAIRFLRLAAGADQAFLSNEHMTMAYGLARHGRMQQLIATRRVG